MAHQLKMRLIEQMNNVVLGSGKEVIDAQHVVAFFEQAFAQMRTQKTCTTCYQNAFASPHVVYNPVTQI